MNQLQINNQKGPVHGLITVTGIALDGRENELVGGVYLEVNDRIYPAYYGYAREDVAQSLKTSRVTRCGFRRDFSASQLGPGRHSLKIGAISRDRKALYQPTNLGFFDVPPIPDAASPAEK